MEARLQVVGRPREDASVKGYMLDTNAFDSMADGDMPADALRGRRLLVTHVQLDELRAVHDFS